MDQSGMDINTTASVESFVSSGYNIIHVNIFTFITIVKFMDMMNIVFMYFQCFQMKNNKDVTIDDTHGYIQQNEIMKNLRIT